MVKNYHKSGNYKPYSLHTEITKKCKNCGQEFPITETDNAFYERMKVPHPTLCPDCRREQLLAHWPYGILQKRKCDFSGETIISPYGPDSRFPVYKREHWYSDKWNPPEMDIDFSRPFFDQLYELQSKSPHFHQFGKNNINCDYADDVWECKNMYLSRSSGDCEDMYYSYRNLYSKDCFDITYCYRLEQCYECVYCFKGFNLKFCSHCWDCSDSYFLYDCKGTRNSFMCWNLRNKQYHILNKPYSKKEYEEKIAEFKLNSRGFLEKLKEEFKGYVGNSAIHRANFNVNTQNCEGNYLTDSKNCEDCFLLEDTEDGAHLFRCPKNKDGQDMVGVYRTELCYATSEGTDLYNVQFSDFCIDVKDSQYIDQCVNCTDLFGCVSLKRKKYCILNKQYSKEDYFKLREKIIEHMKETGEYGEFLPYKFAYNGFNLSLASFYFSETEESIKAKGGFFEKEPRPAHSGIDANTLPDTSEEIADDIIGKPFNCSATGKTYSFLKYELDFYRRHKLPLPTYYPEQRNIMRYKQLIPLKPRPTNCTNCRKEIITYYPENWDYKHIVCHNCYEKLIY